MIKVFREKKFAKKRVKNNNGKNKKESQLGKWKELFGTMEYHS